MFVKLDKTMIKFYIYALILFLFNSCHTLINLLRSTFTNCIRSLTKKRDNYKPDLVKRLRKLPLHLGLVIVEEDELSISDLARIVAWSMIVGVSCVSVYDHRGQCKLKEEELITESSKEFEKLKGKVYLNGMCKKNSDSKSILKNGYRNHFNKILGGHLHILGPNDGQSKIMNITRELCSQDNLRLNDVNTQFVDSLIQKHLGFSDPDLVFRFGNTQSMLGYLPWHMRLTEIFSLTTHKNLGFSEFFYFLDSFADIKQRCGV